MPTRRGTPKRPCQEEDLPDNVIVCNCAQCGRLLLGLSSPVGALLALPDDIEPPPTVYEKVDGRPYCRGCAPKEDAEQPARMPQGTVGKNMKEDTHPWQDNALRYWEDFT